MRNIDPPVWLETAGGPLILLEEDLVPDWRGYLPIPDSTVTDYDRACEVSDYLGTVEVGSRSGVVFGDQPYSATWWHSRKLDSDLIVRWVCAENDASVVQALTDLSNRDWERTDVEFEVTRGRLLLFDSAAPGDHIDAFILIELPKGRYVAETLQYDPNKDTSLLLHRFVRRPD